MLVNQSLFLLLFVISFGGLLGLYTVDPNVGGFFCGDFTVEMGFGVGIFGITFLY
jgi:hypothetical protein